LQGLFHNLVVILKYALVIVFFQLPSWLVMQYSVTLTI
jgi:hypothetical protein